MRLATILVVLSLLCCVASTVGAFPRETCGPEECRDCHFLSSDEAREIMGDLVEEVEAVNFSPVSGFWEIIVVKGGKRFPVYLDFTRNYLLSGELVSLGTMENITGNRLRELNKVDVAAIPLEDAVVIGDPAAGNRIIVFDDPECPYCAKLHPEMKAAAAMGDVAFFIKMLPLKIHPTAYDKAKAIICSKSAQMLEDSLRGKEIPPPDCETDQIEKNAEVALGLGIRSVPTLVFPDGLVLSGYRTADSILKQLEESLASLPPRGK